MTERRTIEVGALARVEGEGALHVTLEGSEVADLRLEIYEPPRFFEAFLRGRPVTELPDLVARICGICPVAYQMSVIHALEGAFEVDIDPQVRALRRLYYAGEWIESHVLHMMFLAAPDFLGLHDGIEVAREHRAEVERALSLRSLGNRIVSLLGARPVNPVGVCIGGFHRAPSVSDLGALGEELRRARGDAEALLRWFAELPVPTRPRDTELVSLRHPAEYPMNEGRIVSTQGVDATPAVFDEIFEEHQIAHSNALHSRVRGRGAYMVGPLARVTLNRDRLSPAATAALGDLSGRFNGFDESGAATDPAASVFARGIEVIQAFDEAVSVVDGYEPPPPPPAWEPRAATGHAATEAPRGLLQISVTSDAHGEVQSIRIVPPTSQNQAAIEADLRLLVPDLAARSDEELRHVCESAIRDYDPCISCSVHFLDLKLERRPDRPATPGDPA